MPIDAAPEGDSTAEMLRKFKTMIAGMNVTELGEVAEQVMAIASSRAMAGAPSIERPPRRRPRRSDWVTYRVRIDLAGARPPIWRRLELSSTMFLDELHRVVQIAFGWTDTHLHRFALGESVWDQAAELYLCPFDVDEGEDDGVPTHEVRLDEVLVEVGDTLLYVYDYGDGWEHRIRLEAVIERAPAASAAIGTGGRGNAPPEDSGGVHAANDRGPGEGSQGADELEPFDVESVNLELLTAASLEEAIRCAPATVTRLLLGAMGTSAQPSLSEMVGDADLGSPVEIGADDAAAMVVRYAWLLDRVGETGIKLTAAGYLPPADVEAAMLALGMSNEWIGKGNREPQTQPVLSLRESAQRMGLLRKHRGHLQLTKIGRKVRADPVALWWHLAARLPGHDSDSIEHQSGMLVLLGTAAGRDISSASFLGLLTATLTAHGWRTAAGHPLSAGSVSYIAWDTVEVLARMRSFSTTRVWGDGGLPTAGGRNLARAALQRQPRTPGS